MRGQAEAQSDQNKKNHGIQKKSREDIYALMTKVESVSESLQKHSKTNSKITQKEAPTGL
jgi:hypothetical protein